MRRRKAKKRLSKARKHLLEQRQRKRDIRDTTKRFLIVCEDGKSAPNYFRALKTHLKLSATSIEVLGSQGGTQPLQVVQRAIEIKKRAASPSSPMEPFDEVWCVIDGDYGVAIHNARSKATANKVQLAVSTMCFEYWILMHFEESNAPTIDCDGLVKLLREKQLPRYDKGTQDFSALVEHVDDACARARRLRERMRDQFPHPETQNPCSEVYLLIEAIQKSTAAAST